MLEEITIIIPTYWGRPSNQAHKENDGIFDHPTPINGDSTLPRLLDSLAKLEADSPKFNVLIIVASVHSDIYVPALECVEAMIHGYSYPIYIFDTLALQKWQSLLGSEYRDLLGMDNYARIRNNQLLVPHVMGSQIIIALDDDEVVEPDYLKQAIKFDKSGIAGIYINADDTPWLAETSLTNNPYLDKAKIMNDALRQMMKMDTELIRTPLAYGGNMIFRRDLWEQVPFDPGITRGEDIDYVLNARFEGIDFYLNPQLKIIHLPPHHYNTELYIKLSEDVRRFIYEAKKFEHYGATVTIEELEPYPGKLMKADNQEILDVLENMYTPDMPQTPAEVLEQAHAHAKLFVPQYAKFLSGWRKLMQKINQDDNLRKNLLKSWLGIS